MTSQLTDQRWVAPEVEELLARLPAESIPDHTDLPDSDEEIVENYNEFPQTLLLTAGIQPLLETLHPDGHYIVGGSSGIYYDLKEVLDGRPLRGVLAPDWHYVPGVPPVPYRVKRRSYILWKDRIRPLIVIEYVSDNLGKEHDRTPRKGKFWIYENAIQATYYVILNDAQDAFEVYQRREHGSYELLVPDERGLVEIEPLGVAIGLWYGHFITGTWHWLRWHTLDGNVMPIGDEIVAVERQRANAAESRADAAQSRANAAQSRADAERQRADAERQRAEKLAAQLRALGIDPDA